MLFPRYGVVNKKKGICEVILQMLVIIVYVDLLKIQRFDNTVKSAHAVTCVEMSLISCSVIIFFLEFEPLLRGHLSYKTIYLCPKDDLLIQV